MCVGGGLVTQKEKERHLPPLKNKGGTLGKKLALD